MPGSPRYLRKPGNVWQVVVEIPPNLRDAFGGKPRFIKSLGTQSLSEAERLKHNHVANFKRQIKVAREGLGDPNAKLFRLAAEFRHELDTADRTTQDGPDGHEFSEYQEELDRLKEAAKEIAETYGPEGPALARRFFNAATGKATLVKDHYETWIAQDQVTAQTKALNAFAVRRYFEWSHANVSIEETTRRKAREFINHLIDTSGLARKTIGRYASSLASLWEWLQASGLTAPDAPNPWRGHNIAQKAKRSGKGVRKALSDDQLVRLLNHVHPGKHLYRDLFPDLLRIELVTGARLEELCNLKKAQIEKREDGYWIEVLEGKTEAAKRQIPIHSIVAPIIERRLSEIGEYLFAGLKAGGADQRRSHEVTKRYGTYRKAAGVKERWQDFHALRNTFIAMMEGVEAPESSVKLIVGHERGSMTYGRYSKGERVKLREVINMLRYGEDVMNLLRSER